MAWIVISAMANAGNAGFCDYGLSPGDASVWRRWNVLLRFVYDQ